MAEPRRIALSALDNTIAPVFTIGNFLVPLAASETPATVHRLLQDGLDKTVRQMPILGGVVVKGEADGRLEVAVPRQPEASTRNTTLGFADLAGRLPGYVQLVDAGVPQRYFNNERLLLSGYRRVDDPRRQGPVFMAQANFVEGGYVLTVGFDHSVFDGTGWGTVMRTWAQNCLDGAALPLAAGSDDRSILQRLWEAGGRHTCAAEEEDEEDEEESAWNLLGLSRQERSRTTSPAPVQPSIFYVPVSAVARLRDEAVAGGRAHGLSVTDALVSLVWRCVTRARVAHAAARPRGDALVRCTLDARPTFAADLPGDYLGNLVFWPAARMPADELVAPATSLGRIASLVRREMAAAATRPRLHEAFALAASIPDGARVERLIASPEPTAIMLTSLLNLPFCGLDFGRAGAADCFRISVGCHASFVGCMILPRRTEGGIEIVTALPRAETELLKRDGEFGKYCYFLCS